MSSHIPQEVKLKFDNKHIQPILSGEKTVTLRLGMDSSDFPEGHPIAFISTDGSLFAEAEVTDRGYTTVEMAAMIEFDGHRNYPDTKGLIKDLQSYYPDEEIGPKTRVDIIEWSKLH